MTGAAESIIAFLDGDGWYCLLCEPSHYCGRVFDALSHLETNHQKASPMVDLDEGTISNKVLEMAGWGE